MTRPTPLRASTLACSRSALQAFGLVLGVLVLSLAAISVAPSPVQADSNEGGTAIDPANRTRQATISAGARHTCVVAVASGTLWCWGDHSRGQLGIGLRTTGYVAVKDPQKVVGLSGVTAVSAGENHTCALLAGGSAWCWGSNVYGQLGTGTRTTSFTPVAVASDLVFTSISAGVGHTCGTTSSQVFCWGDNGSGQLGTGDLTDVLVPTPVAISGVPAMVSAGSLHTCAVMQGGDAYCWGANVYGQLGRGSAGEREPAPAQVIGSGFDAITAAESHTCALTSGGTKCWGDNTYGQLGNGTVGGIRTSPGDIANGNTLEQAITAGTRHTCGRQGQRLRCWGFPYGFNQPSSAVPADVTEYADTEIPAVTAGAFHTCTQLQRGRVECFGSNSNGQLGDGSATSSPRPVRAVDRPSPPANASAAVVAYGTIEARWTEPANLNHIPLSHYRLYDTQGTFSRLIPADRTTETLSDLPSGRTYDLRLVAVNDFGESAPVALASITTPTLPVVLVTDVAQDEGNSGTKNMTFTLSRSGPSGPAFSVKAATRNGTAVAPGDFTAKGPVLISFASGQMSKTFVVSTRGDVLPEDAESFDVVLSSPVGAQLYDNVAAGILLNDDPGEKPYYYFAGGDTSVREGGTGTTYMTFTIGRGGSTAVAGSVQYFTEAGTATPTADYTTKAPTKLSFPVGVTSRTFTVAIKGDYVVEPTEYFQVGLKNAVAGDVPSYLKWGLILNDDSSETPSVSISDAAVAEGDGLTANLTFEVTRLGNLDGTTTVKYATRNGSATAPSDYAAKALTSLSFAPGQTRRTVTVTVKGDNVREGDEEFYVDLSAATGGTIARVTGRASIRDDD